jgi:hypothetical protein
MQLRYLQTLTQVAGDRGTTIVFPVPMSLFQSLAPGKSGDGGERP